MYTQMMDTRKEMREGSRDRRIPDDPVTPTDEVVSPESPHAL
jgi:hypothetical protein